MAPFLVAALFVCAALPALAQRDALWANPQLSERGLQLGEQRTILRRDMSQCHGVAFEGARGIDDEEKRKRAGVALFNRCMAEKGWYVRQPGGGKPPRRAPREAAA